MEGRCAVCGAAASKRCAACSSAYYCSVDHQRADWKAHKAMCKPKTSATREREDKSDRDGGGSEFASGLMNMIKSNTRTYQSGPPSTDISEVVAQHAAAIAQFHADQRISMNPWSAPPTLFWSPRQPAKGSPQLITRACTKLSEMSTATAPHHGVALGGTLAMVPSWKQSDSGSLNTVFVDECGHACKFAIYGDRSPVGVGCSPDFIPGRRVVVLNPWFKRFSDCTVGIRIESADSVAFDCTASDVVSKYKALRSKFDWDSAAEQSLRAAVNSPSPAAWNEALGLSLLDPPGSADWHPLQQDVPEPDLLVPSKELAGRVLAGAAKYAWENKRIVMAMWCSRLCIKIGQQVDDARNVLSSCLRHLGAAEIEAEWLGTEAQRLSTASENGLIAKVMHRNPVHYLGPLRLRSDGKNGRCFVAARDVVPGTLLLIDNAILVGQGSFVDTSSKKVHADFRESLTGVAIREVCGSSSQSAAVLDWLKCMFPTSSSDGAWSPCDDARNMLIQMLLNTLPTTVTAADACHIAKVVTRNCFDSFSSPVCKGSNFAHNNLSTLYTLAALFNHSCIPNASWFSLHSFIVVRATRQIRAGEEVTVTYTDLSLCTATRRKTLMDDRGFMCECPRCSGTSAEAVLLSKQLRELRCPLNPGHVMYPVRCNDEESPYVCSVSGCQGKMSAAESSRKEAESQALLDRLTMAFRTGNWRHAAAVAKEVEGSVMRIIGPNHNNATTLYSGVSACMMSSDHEATVRACRKILDPELPTLVFSMLHCGLPMAMRLMASAFSLRDKGMAVRALKQAYHIFQVHGLGGGENAFCETYFSGEEAKKIKSLLRSA